MLLILKKVDYGDYMDLRIVRTKKNIKEAFFELRKKKPIEKISVKELAALAMINKTTFYLHYEDIYALSDEVENEFIDEIIEEIPQLREKDGIYSYSLISQALITAIDNHREKQQILFSFGRYWVLASKIESRLIELFKENSAIFSNNKEAELVGRILIRGSFFVFDDNSDYDRSTIIKSVLRVAKIAEQIVTESND